MIDLTKLALTPNDLCTPEHSIQIKIPLFTETHELKEPKLFKYHNLYNDYYQDQIRFL